MSTRKRKLSFRSSAKSKKVPGTPVVEPSPERISVPATPVVEPSPPNTIGSSKSLTANDEPSHNQEHDGDQCLSVLQSIPKNQQVLSTCKIILIIKLLNFFFLLHYSTINILFVNSAVNQCSRTYYVSSNR